MDPQKLRAIVARNIRSLAERQDIGLNALADFAGVSRSQLFNVLACTSSASLDWLVRISNALEVEPWVLLRPSGREAKAARRKRA